MSKIVEVNVQSEIGKLNGVILHTPGEEVENMTPENAERALYSDILNLSIARKEYKQLSEVLGKITKTYQVKDLLTNILKDDAIKLEVLNRIEKIEPFIAETTPKGSIKDQLLDENAEDLARLLIEGVEMKRDTLTKFLNKDWYDLRPLHNFFFTRRCLHEYVQRKYLLVGWLTLFVIARQSSCNLFLTSRPDLTPRR